MTKRSSGKIETGKILVGTASWSDPGFVERWYPKKMPAGERLQWYAQHFDMVEVNSTFYSVPEPRMVERWCAATPDDFTFDVKLHQLFSFHSTPAKLLPPELQRRAETDGRGNVKSTPDLQEALLKIFLRATSIFRNAEKLGVFLLQLSPAFSPRKHELGELEPLVDMLARLQACDRVSKPQLGSRRSVAIDNRFYAKASGNFCERGRAQIGSFHGHAIGRR